MFCSFIFFLLKADQALKICLELGFNDGSGTNQVGMPGSHMATLPSRLPWFWDGWVEFPYASGNLSAPSSYWPLRGARILETERERYF